MLVYQGSSQNETSPLVLVTPSKDVPLSLSLFLASLFVEEESDGFGPFSFHKTITKSIHPRDVTHVVPRSCYKFASSSKDQDDESDETDETDDYPSVQVYIILEENYYIQLKSENRSELPNDNEDDSNESEVQPQTIMDALIDYCEVKSYGSRRRASKLPEKLRDFVAPSRPSNNRSKTSKRK